MKQLAGQAANTAGLGQDWPHNEGAGVTVRLLLIIRHNLSGNLSFKCQSNWQLGVHST